MAHDPPCGSRYNPIEHRLFPHATKACQGIAFHSMAMVVRAMERTPTRTGLSAAAAVVEGEYPTGEKAPPGYKESMGIVFAADLPKWNCRAAPLEPGS